MNVQRFFKEVKRKSNLPVCPPCARRNSVEARDLRKGGKFACVFSHETHSQSVWWVRNHKIEASATMARTRLTKMRRIGGNFQRGSNEAAPFAEKKPSSLGVFMCSGGGSGGGPMQWRGHSVSALEALKKDYGEEEEKSTIVSKTVCGEIETDTLTLSRYQLLAVQPRRRFSRMRNFEADSWNLMAHEKADAFVYFVKIEQTESYLVGESSYSHRTWENDRSTISRLLRKPSLVENPRKPFLLLVNNDEDDEFDVERLATLFGLGGYGFERPFRAVSYSSNQSDGTLRESLEWLVNTASSSDDDVTAMTGSDTEEGGSVVTSTTTSTAASSFVGSGHYVLDYEPTLLGGNPVLQRFEPIKKGTHCPFARAAKLWGGKLADELTPRLNVDSLEEAASLNAGPLAEFVARSNNGEPLDGFCLEIPGGAFCAVEKLGETVRVLLTKLAELDPSGENAMKMGPFDHPHWRFRFAGEDFFLTTFSPAYGKESSRYSFGVWRSFVLFQPMTSFGRHGLVSDTPASATNWNNPTTMRDKARVAFKKNGCPYHIPETLPYPVAEHVVKPKNDDGTTVVRWWESPEESQQPVG